MAVDGLVRIQEAARAKKRAERQVAKTRLPAASRVSTPKQTNELDDLDALFRKKAFSTLEAHFPRFEELLTQDDLRERRASWEIAFKHLLVPRQAGASGGGGGGQTKIVFNFPDGDPPVDITPHDD